MRLTLIGHERDDAQHVRVVRMRAQQLGLDESSVVLRGVVTRGEASEIVARAHVGVMPSSTIDASAGVASDPLFDYMAAGVAVVAPDATAAARIVRSANAGEVYQPGDASSLAQAIERFTDPYRCAAAGDAGQRVVLERYHWEQDAATLSRSVSLLARERHCIVA